MTENNNDDQNQTFTLEQAKQLAADAVGNAKGDFLRQIAELKDSNASLSEFKTTHDAKTAADDEAAKIANQEHQSVIDGLKVQISTMENDHKSAAKKASDTNLDLTLQNAGMADELARAGAVTMYDGETPVADWLKTLQEKSPTSFTVGTVKAPPKSTGPAGIVTQTGNADMNYESAMKSPDKKVRRAAVFNKAEKEGF